MATAGRGRSKRSYGKAPAWWVVAAVAVGGCIPQAYEATPTGTFTGALEVRWLRNDLFSFEPDADEPFAFVRATGEVIEPGPMVTDGGTIPRALWAIRGFSPMGYLPAFILHDWMFQARHCGLVPPDAYDFEASARVFAEALKTVMESDHRVRDASVFAALVGVLGSPIVRTHWAWGACRDALSDAIVPTPRPPPPPRYEPR